MRTIGIDLGVKGAHKAVITDEGGRFISPVLTFTTTPVALRHLLAEAHQDNPDSPVQAVLEPTGMAWFPVAVFLIHAGVQVFLVNSQQVADLRRYYKKHAKSDRIDCRVLAKLPLVNAENLHAVQLAGAVGLACQRGCKELERLMKQSIAAKNRLIALDRFVWPGLEEVFEGLFSPACRWFRQYWYDPQQVCRAGEAGLRLAWSNSQIDPPDPGDWIKGLVQIAARVVDLYGSTGQELDFAALQAEAGREQALLAFLEEQHHQLQIQTVRPLYRQMHPSRNLETIPGVGQDGACVYAAFIGHPERFASLRAHRSWSGMVPNSKQSSTSQASGLKITQAGPRLIKKFSFLDAETARQRDPQIAALYYDQMVHKGKHHTQAVCTCATHLLDRVLRVLSEDRAYELRDVDGQPVTPAQALEIIQARYHVPAEVRARNRKRARRESREQQAEKKRKGGTVTGSSKGPKV
jgi:transposase